MAAKSRVIDEMPTKKVLYIEKRMHYPLTIVMSTITHCPSIFTPEFNPWREYSVNIGQRTMAGDSSHGGALATFTDPRKARRFARKLAAEKGFEVLRARRRRLEREGWI